MPIVMDREPRLPRGNAASHFGLLGFHILDCERATILEASASVEPDVSNTAAAGDAQDRDNEGDATASGSAEPRHGVAWAGSSAGLTRCM